MMKQLRTSIKTDRGNQTIDGAANREPPSSAGPIESDGSISRPQSIEKQNRKGLQDHSHPCVHGIVPNPLEHLAVDNLGQSNRSIHANEFGKMLVKRRSRSLEKLNPYGRINHDHDATGRDRRSRSRSPSHVTRPRKANNSRRLAILRNSRSAKSTSSRLDLHPDTFNPRRTSCSSNTMFVRAITSPPSYDEPTSTKCTNQWQVVYDSFKANRRVNSKWSHTTWGASLDAVVLTVHPSQSCSP